MRVRTSSSILIGAVGLAMLAVVGLVPMAAGTVSSGPRNAYFPINPCRLADTRAAFVVGPRNTPLGPNETYTVAVRGAQGNCSIPAGAEAVVMNVTIASPTASGYLTVFPADQPKPLAANLNWTANQAPEPNAVTVGLASATGDINIFNNSGTVQVIIDLVGYFEGHDHDDRYYTKSATQARIAGNSLTCSAGSFLRAVAADGTPTCDAAPVVPSPRRAFVSQSGLALPSSGITHFQAVTASFVVPANVTSCLVSSTIQAQPNPGAPSGIVYFRNARSVNGSPQDDGQYGHYLITNGTTSKQAPHTRTSVIPVSAGQTVQFGVFFGDLIGAWFDSPYAAVTSYDCS